MYKGKGSRAFLGPGLTELERYPCKSQRLVGGNGRRLSKRSALPTASQPSESLASPNSHVQRRPLKFKMWCNKHPKIVPGPIRINLSPNYLVLYRFTMF